jgi:hypothetical protein
MRLKFVGRHPQTVLFIAHVLSKTHFRTRGKVSSNIDGVERDEMWHLECEPSGI